MTPKINDADIPFVAKVERETGLDIAEVKYYTILPPLQGTCKCGNPVPEYINICWCDDCLDLFNATNARGENGLAKVKERWANVSR